MSKQRKHINPSVNSVNLASKGLSPLIVMDGIKSNTKGDYWLWGSDNLLPVALARIARRSSTHRAILNKKSEYCAGKRITTPDTNFENFIKSVNVNSENLRAITNYLIYDRFSQGNEFIEVVKDKKGKFCFIYRHDPLNCRLGKNDYEGQVLLLADWSKYATKKTTWKEIPLYPYFKDTGDGLLRAIIHIKDKEQGFQNYGVPTFIAGLQPAAITYKTDKWNVSRLDNSFNSSAVITVEDDFESDVAAEKFRDKVIEKFTGEGSAGKVIVITKGINDGTTTVQPLDSGNEGEWEKLHQTAQSDLIIAHEWYRSLSGIADNTGFDTQRILNEYQVALNTTIIQTQQEYINLYQKIFVNYFDVEDLAFENTPPINLLSLIDPGKYMTIGEARKMAGLEVDENDPKMNELLGTKETVKEVAK